MLIRECIVCRTHVILLQNSEGRIKGLLKGNLKRHVASGKHITYEEKYRKC